MSCSPWQSVRVHEHREAVLGAFAFLHGLREFAGEQLLGVEHDLARVAHVGAVGEEALQFAPADLRAVFHEDFDALRFDVGGERLAGVFGGEGFGHGRIKP